MKKAIKIASFLLLASIVVFASKPPKKTKKSLNKNYIEVMKESIKRLQTATKKEDFIETANQFERIANTETKEWEPAYWAAYAYIQATSRETDKTKKDPILDKADSWISKGQSLSKDNDEILILTALSSQYRLPIDPMSRWAKYGGLIGSSLEQAKKINPNNPRVYYVFGLNYHFTPESFGGGKKKSLPYFETALEKLNSFKPASEIAPTWGEGEIKYFISECKK